MNRRRPAALGFLAAMSLVLAACGGGGSTDSSGGGGGETSGGGGGDSTAIITVNGTEPQNPLLPSHTSETGGGRIVNQLFSRLVAYQSDGSVENELAESIESEDSQNWTIKIKPDQTFADGSPLTAQSFVDAWNYAALLSNAQNASYFFEDIEGFSYDEDSELTGLEVVDDTTFTVALKAPAADFPVRLGYTAYAPLPEVAFEDMEAFGQNPIGNGPYKMAEEGAWQHDVRVDMVANENYEGPREPQNGGVSVVFYTQEDAAYADVLSGNLDIIENIPNSSITTFEDELEGRSVNQPAAVIQVMSVPEYLPEWGGEAGHLRREAVSHAINRPEITQTIFNDTRTPALDFTSPVIDGWSENVPGNEVLEYDPELAKQLWDQAEAIEPWGDQPITISTNTDSDHQVWVDAVTNGLRNTLGVDAEMNPYAQFSEFLDARDNQQVPGLFRGGWQGDYPTLSNFLAPIYTTGAASNDAFYSSPEFEALMQEGNAADSIDEANAKYNEAQTVLFNDLPGIPLWYQNVTGGWADTVDNVEFGWDGEPLLHQVTKEG